MIAVALSPNARALIQASRDAHRPTAADRERVTTALRARLGSAVLPFDAPSRSRLGGAGQRRAATAFGLCVVGSMLFLARRPVTAVEPAAQVRPKRVEAAMFGTATARATATATAASEVAPPSEITIPPQRKVGTLTSRHTRGRVAPASAGEDTLAQEVLLLTSATSQLSSGQAAEALLQLDEHQRRFSNGVLSYERNAAKARALCMLHRFSEGRALLAQLGGGSVQAARITEVCDSVSSRAAAPSSAKPSEHD